MTNIYEKALVILHAFSRSYAPRLMIKHPEIREDLAHYIMVQAEIGWTLIM